MSISHQTNHELKKKKTIWLETEKLVKNFKYIFLSTSFFNSSIFALFSETIYIEKKNKNIKHF